MNKNRFFKLLADFVYKRHKLVIVISILALGLAVVSISKYTNVKTNIKDLLGNKNTRLRAFNEINKKFKSASTVLVVIEGKKDEMISFCQKLVRKIKASRGLLKYIKNIDYKSNRKFMLEKGLLLSKVEDLKALKHLLKSYGFLGFFTGINKSFEDSYSIVDTHQREHEVVRFLDGFEITLDSALSYLEAGGNGPADNYAARMAEGISLGEKYFFTPKKNMMLVRIHPLVNSDEYGKATVFINSLRKTIKSVSGGYTGIKVSLGGTLPLVVDEMIVTEKDIQLTSYVALLVIILLFYFSFKSFYATALSLATLLFGIFVSFGICIFFVREVNNISVFFLLILIGLGIDYGIHIISHFFDYLKEDGDVKAALFKTYSDSGLGIIIGALTTSIAFFMLILTSAKAFKQLGVFAGVGILGCLVFMMVLLPAFLVLRYKNKKPVALKSRTARSFSLEGLGRFVVKKRYLTILFMILLVAVAFYLSLKIGFDYDLLKMQPKGTSGKYIAERLTSELNTSPSFVVTYESDIERAKRYAKRFELLSHVGRVDSISDFIPSVSGSESQKNRLKIIKEMHFLAEKAIYAPLSRKSLPKIIYQLKDFRDRIRELRYADTLGDLTLVRAKRENIIKTKKLFARLINYIKNADDKAVKKLLKLEKAFYLKYKKRMVEMSKIGLSNNYPVITLSNLPDDIKNNYIDEAGKNFIIRVYPKKNIWEERYLRKFTLATTRINNNITGMPVVFLEISDIMKVEGRKAILFAFIAIFILLVINYFAYSDRNLVKRPLDALLKTCLTLVPLIFGAILMTGIMKLLAIDFNLYNVTAIPLLLGMGIDDGVHITQRYIHEKYKNMDVVLKHTGKGVVITTLTTMASLGSMGFLARHVGMATFGLLLFIGMATCLLVSITLLPSLLSVFLKNKNKE